MKRANNLGESFRYAFSGVWYALGTQRNLRVHVIVGVLAVLLSWLLAIALWAFVVILLASIAVMALELVNTAVETVVDLVSPEFHPLAKVAKDVAAGSVLVATLGAFLLGLIIFLPHVGQVWPDFVLRWNQSPSDTLAVFAVAIFISIFALWMPHSHRARRRL